MPNPTQADVISYMRSMLENFIKNIPEDADTRPFRLMPHQMAFVLRVIRDKSQNCIDLIAKLEPINTTSDAELLAALKGMVDFVDSLGGDEDDALQYKAAVAAIEKAEAGQGT